MQKPGKIKTKKKVRHHTNTSPSQVRPLRKPNHVMPRHYLLKIPRRVINLVLYNLIDICFK